MRSFVKRYDPLLILLAVCLVLLYVQAAGGGFPLDDSWIHQVYGRNLGDHGEWAFVSGEPSAASTSPFYTVLLAVGYALNIPYVFWTHLLGVVALSLTGIISARMAEHLQPDKKWIGLVCGITLILSWHLIWSAASGMETMLFSMFTLLLIYVIWMTDTTDLRNGAVFGVLAALMTMTRPEGMLLAGLCGLSVLIKHKWGARWWVMGTILGFFVAMLPYFRLNFSLTGGLLPATANAKQAQHQPLLQLPLQTRLWDMTLPILVGAQAVLLPGVGFYLWRYGRHHLQYVLPLLWAIGLITLYALRLPAAYQHGRYVIPALPGFILMGSMGVCMLVDLTAEVMIPRVFARTLAAGAGVILLYFGLYQGPLIYRQDVRIIEEEMVASAHWIAANLPPDELLALHDIGAVGYFAPRPILDIAGLVSEEAAVLIGDADGLWQLMQQKNAHYLMAFPDQIPGRDLSDERLCFLHQSDGTTSPDIGGPKMVVYELAFNDGCKTELHK